MDLMILAPVGAVAALLYAFILSKRVMSYSEGTELMQKIAASIRSGANAYLRRQYKGVGIFFVIMGVVLLGLAFAGLVNIFVPVAFVVGGIFSGLSGCWCPTAHYGQVWRTFFTGSTVQS